MKTDAQLLADVQAELEWDPSVDSRDIVIAVRGAAVTLAGHVTSLLDKWHAESAVKRVLGVRALANEIEVKPAVSAQPPDSEIAYAAAIALQSNASVPATAIRAIVSEGRVTLEGNVEFFYQKEAAELAVRSLRGVQDIKNSIVVEPHSSAHQLHEQIRAALQRHAVVHTATIDVEVADGGVVTLCGEVGSWHEREAAQNVASTAPGIRRVINHLRVGHADAGGVTRVL